MTVSTRIKGKAASFSLAATDYSGDCSSIVLENEAGKEDVVTFADAAAGGAVSWKFTVKAIQSADASALWSYLWGASGTTGVAYEFAPQGNAIASVTQPHYTGTCSIGPKPPIGGDADSTFVFDVTIGCDQEPTAVTA